MIAQNADLDQEIIIQRLLTSLENKDHKDVLLQIDRLRQVDPMLSGEILYYEASSAYATGNKQRAEHAARAYVTSVGQNGPNYSAALTLLADLEREVEAQEAVRRKQEQEQEILRKAAAEAERNRQASVEAERMRQAAIAAEAERKRQAAHEAESMRIARIVEPAVKSILASLKEIPGGNFMMGSDKWPENPTRLVTINPFRMMEHEVTFAQWDACVAAGACSKPGDMKWGRGDQPVIRVSGEDILDGFIPWLNKTTGQTFRLPTEAEWEYAARAGTTTKYSWGDNISCSHARYGRPNPLAPDSPASCGNDKGTMPVKSFEPNAFGLFDMHGNVAEIVQDCIGLGLNNYENSPSDGRSATNFECEAPFSRHMIRGGSWSSEPDQLRSAYREGYELSEATGFRLAQDL
ncbi:SUMF1/EgtB/PvdO family nonheme iron enzyme [Methylophaga sp.]|uniref:SUMF1/EgtB/PvdO family nonheme iron enzyme n=1 Tax=Methylophaga sp. TaxID=2024840 RepID=UPI00271697BC|nr:SUMF1/EgtB/PvdO family nonheme iron enzyme [Methylophaga sp.]MDO8826958.1 SUMF1/EgtB/PvdO family nonheme iron enzyme [Methylophaga sp.]